MTDSLAIVGLGPANVNLFAELVRQTRTLERLCDDPAALPRKKIYLIDHEQNHGTGKAWGRHAHPSMLYSTKAGGRGGDGFGDWLCDHDHKWLPAVEAHRHGALKTWFRVNEEKLAAKEYDKIYMPRFVYGMFRKECLMDVLQNLPACFDVTILDGKVTGIEKGETGKNILQFEKPAREIRLATDKAGQMQISPKTGKSYDKLPVDIDVIGVGPPEPTAFTKVQGHPDYFADPTSLHPNGEGENFAAQFKHAVLKKFRATGRKVEVGVLGAGLSFLDMVNLIYNDDELKHAIHLTSISSSGYARTQKEAPDSKQKDTAPESQMALDGLNVSFIAAKVEDVEPGAHRSGITVKTSDQHLDEPGYRHKPGARSDKHAHHFDIVTQALGFKKWRDIGVIKSGLEKGLFKEDLTTRSLAADENMALGAGSYANGFIMEKNVTDYLQARGKPHQGFLDNSYRYSPYLASALSQELFGEEIRKAAQNLELGQLQERPTIERFGAAECVKQAPAL